MSSRLKIVVSLLFVLSGITGLIYETLWVRILSLGVGSTSASLSLVLSIFFLGLSAGSFFAGRKSYRLLSPLHFYGILELSLGIYSALIIFPLLHFHQIFSTLTFGGTLPLFAIPVKFLIVLILLAIPTLIMGATLPLLVKFFIQESSNKGRVVSVLYAINTLGAAAGAMITGFVLIPRLGLLGANTLGAATNILIGLVAIRLHHSLKLPKSRLSPAPVNPSKEAFWKSLNRTQWAVVLSCGASGFISIASEVVWNKYLGIFLGTNIYGLGLVLALYLFGIAVGSLAISIFIDRIQKQIELYTWLFIFSVLLVVGSSVLVNEAPKLVTQSYFLMNGKLGLLTVKSLVVTAILFLPTFVFGALLPLAIRIISSSSENMPAMVGLAYSVNTVGAILGSYFAGLVFIPHFGSSVTIQITAYAAAFASLALIFLGGTGKIATKSIQAALSIAAAVLVFTYGHFEFKNLIKSAYHQSDWLRLFPDAKTPEEKKLLLESALEPYKESFEEFKFLVEGETGIISLTQDPRDGAEYRNYLRLKHNGLNESIYWLKNLEILPKYEALIGLLPYVFVRDPQNAFVVGYGGGYTVDFLTKTDIRDVQVVELEKGILEAADYVYDGKNPIVSRPNLNLKIEDARFILASKKLKPMDIIISQPSHSWLTGAANLFTKEFFEIVRGNLSDKGIYSQWLNLYNMDVDVLKSILKTFYEVFPYGAVFTQSGDFEMVLLGSKTPLQLNLKKLESIAANPTFQHKLVQVFQQSPYDLLSLYSLSREEIKELTSDSLLNTDINAFAEVNQSVLFYEGLQGKQTPQQYLSSVFRGDYSKVLRADRANDPQFFYNLLISLDGIGQTDKFSMVFPKYEAAMKDRPDGWQSLGYFTLKFKRYASAENYLKAALKNKKDVGVLNLLLNTYFSTGNYKSMMKVLQENSSLRDSITDCYLADTLLETGKHLEAKVQFEKILKKQSDYTASCGAYVNRILGNYFYSKKDYAVAIRFFEAYYQAFPKEIEPLKRLVESYRAISDSVNERAFQEYLDRLIESDKKERGALADYFDKAGWKADATALRH